MIASLLEAGLTIADVGRLTSWQIRHLYQHPRDKHGQLKIVPQGEEITYEEQFRGLWRCRGLPEYRIEQKWRQHVRSAGDG